MIMTQDKARKAATRQRMAETGEPYTEASHAVEREHESGAGPGTGGPSTVEPGVGEPSTAGPGAGGPGTGGPGTGGPDAGGPDAGRRTATARDDGWYARMAEEAGISVAEFTAQVQADEAMERAERALELAERARERAGQAQAAAEQAQDAAEQAHDAAEQAQDAAFEAAERADELAGEYGGGPRERWHRPPQPSAPPRPPRAPVPPRAPRPPRIGGGVLQRFDQLWEQAEEMVIRAGQLLGSSETRRADHD
jgi:hypothetical protein